MHFYRGFGDADVSSNLFVQVIGATAKLCLTVAISASGPTAMASPNSSLTSLTPPSTTAMAAP